MRNFCQTFCSEILMQHFDETLCWDILMRHFDETFWWYNLIRHFDETFWWYIMIRLFDEKLEWKILMDILMRYFDEKFWLKLLMTQFDGLWKIWRSVLTFNDHRYSDDVNEMALCQFWLSLVYTMWIYSLNIKLFIKYTIVCHDIYKNNLNLDKLSFAP